MERVGDFVRCTVALRELQGRAFQAAGVAKSSKCARYSGMYSNMLRAAFSTAHVRETALGCVFVISQQKP